MPDVDAEVAIGVTGSDELAKAAAAAQRLADDIRKATEQAEGLAAGSAGVEELQAAIDQATDSAELFSRAADTARDSLMEMGASGDAVEAVSAQLAQGADFAEAFAKAVGEARDDLAELDAEGPAAGDAAVGLYNDAVAAQAYASALAEVNAQLAIGDAGQTVALDPAIGARYANVADEMDRISRSADNAESNVRNLGTDISSTFLAGQDAARAGADAYTGMVDGLDEATAAIAALEAVQAVLSGTMDANAAEALLDAGSMDALAAASAAADATLAGEGAAGGSGGLIASLSSVMGFFKGFGDISIPGWMTSVALWGSIGGLIAGAVSVLTPLVEGTVAFGLLGAPALMKLYHAWESVSTAQKAYKLAQQTEQRDPTTSNLAAEKKALAQLNAAYADVPANVRPALASIHQVISAWEEAARKSGIQNDVLKDIPLAADAIKGAIPATTSLAQAFAPLVSGGLKDLIHFQQSKGFKTFITDLDKDMPPAAHAVGQLGSAIGGLIADLTTPGAVKTADNMFSSIASGLKGITPGGVHELEQAEKALGGIGNIGADMGKKSSGWATFARGWDDFWTGARNVSNWTKDANKIGGDTLRALFGNYPSGESFTQHWKQEFSNLDPAAVAAGKKAGTEFSKSLDEAMLLKQHDLPGAKAAGEQTGKDIAAGVKSGLSGAAGSTSSGLQKSVDDATKNVKIHGATVDLADAKLSGLGQLQSVLAKAAQTAGKDYDTALGNAIEGQAASVTAHVKDIVNEINRVDSGLGPAGQAAGEALGQGLAAGITASTPAAVAAATSLANQVTAAVRAAHQTASPSKVFAEIGRDDIAGLIMGLEEGKYTLAEVIKALDPTTALKHLITTAEQYGKSIVSAAESGASLSSLWGQTQAGQMAAGMAPPVYGNIADAMKASIKQIKEFDADIKRLKREGLSKNLIEQLLQEGPTAGLAQAQSILGGGKGYIAQLDNLERQIQKYSDQLGKTAVSDKYAGQIGADVAKGMAPGWHAVVAAIKSQAIRVEVHVDAPVTVDGKKLARVNQTYTLQHAGRNISSGLKLANRGI